MIRDAVRFTAGNWKYGDLGLRIVVRPVQRTGRYVRTAIVAWRRSDCAQLAGSKIERVDIEIAVRRVGIVSHLQVGRQFRPRARGTAFRRRKRTPAC